MRKTASLLTLSPSIRSWGLRGGVPQQGDGTSVFCPPAVVSLWIPAADKVKGSVGKMGAWEQVVQRVSLAYFLMWPWASISFCASVSTPAKWFQVLA